ncbi:MAG TPA: ATP-grasp domain-containing protein [Candidatus Aquicultor sp.]|jgi:carbamoyl-phosphate synthase large subunit
MSTGNGKTIFLTGAGGAAVPGLIKRLKNQGYFVIAADMDPLAVGLYYADKSFVIPPGDSVEFLPVILRICREEKVDAVIPLVDEELLKCAELESHNIAVVLPKYEFIKACLDKYVLTNNLKEANIPVPKTKLASNGHEGLLFPVVVKPRTGRGSRGLHIVGSEQELVAQLEKTNYPLDALILQEYIEGTEYTISVVVWRDGEVQAVVPKEIISKKGITRLAVTRHDAGIEELCCKVQHHLHADGPFNVQLRVDARRSEPLIFEINPRFSTTISLTIAAGIDELDGILNQAFDGRESYQFGKWQEGIVLLRQTLDQFIDEADFQACSARNSAKHN